MHINWTWGETIRFRDAQWSVDSRTNDGKGINLHHQADNRWAEVLESELIVAFSEGTLVRLGKPMSAITEAERKVRSEPMDNRDEKAVKEAERRSHYVKEWAKRRYRKMRNTLMRKVIAEVADRIEDAEPPSVRTYRRWLNRWFAEGAPDLRDARSLMPMWHNRGNSDPRFHANVLEIIERLIKEHLLRPERKPVEEIHGMVTEAASNLDVEGVEPRFLDAEGKMRVPSLRTFYEIARHIPKDVLIRSQRGQQEADAKTRPIGAGPKGDGPLTEVEFDHTLLDVMVVDTTRNVVLGRPWLTVAIDRATRMVVGRHIGFDAPGTYSVMRCMHNLILPKQHERESCPGVENENPAYGVPYLIVLDNAAEFHGYSLLVACLALNIDIRYSPRAKAWYKGKVERWFHTAAKQFFHTLPGTTFSNAKERGRYKSEKMAVLTLAELDKLLTKYINDIYHVQWHEGLGAAPLPTWLKAMEDKNKVVSLPASLDELDVLLGRVEECQLTNRGIQLYGLMYNQDTPQMRELINRPGMPPRVRVWVNDDDLNSVHIQDPESEEYIEVPSTDPEYTLGLSKSLHDLVTARYRADRADYKRATMKDLIRCKRELREDIQRIQDSKRKSKRLSAVKDSHAKAVEAALETPTPKPPARKPVARKPKAASTTPTDPVVDLPLAADALVKFAVQNGIRISNF